MRTVTILLAIAGLILGTALVAYFGFGEVVHGLLAVGWTGFLAIIAYHLAGIALLGFCWYVLSPRRVPLRAYVWGRLIRDSGAELLPLSQLGGFVMGARAATLLGVSGAAATASTVVDVTLEVVGQLGYTALGLLLLARLKPQDPLIGWVALGIVAGMVTIALFILVQRHALGRIETLVRRIAQRWSTDAAVDAQPLFLEIHAIYRRPARLYLGALLHWAAWVAGSVEAWFALRLMGAPLSIGAVIVLESLLYAARSVAFAVPNAVGVQEGAYIMLGAAFGLSPEVALALSLLKRARDVVIGAPALVAWQMLESQRLLRRRGEPQPAAAPVQPPPRRSSS
jgi:glycosyltransferase 2 family protein